MNQSGAEEKPLGTLLEDREDQNGGKIKGLRSPAEENFGESTRKRGRPELRSAQHILLGGTLLLLQGTFTSRQENVGGTTSMAFAGHPQT